MLQESQKRKFAHVAMCAAFGMILVVAGSVGSAFAAEADDEDDALPDVKFFRSIMRGIGLRNGQEAGIDYGGERPPLVVPPSRDLPPPVTTGSITAGNPAWPADPDQKKRAAERKARVERKPVTNVYASGDPLKPSELAAGKSDTPSVKSGRGPDYSPELTPSELGYTNGLWNSFKSIGNVFSRDKEPETDPPPGYRTPSPAHPYGVNTRDSLPKATNADPQTGQFGK
jgi:hypothetical protein